MRAYQSNVPRITRLDFSIQFSPNNNVSTADKCQTLLLYYRQIRFVFHLNLPEAIDAINSERVFNTTDTTCIFLREASQDS